MRPTRSTFCLLCALLLGCQNVGKIDAPFLGRAAWQQPDDVVRALGIDAGDSVADLGAGKGYFVPYLSEAVGPDGRVYAVDVDPERTSALEERFGETDSNVEILLGRYEDPLLPDAAIDVVLIVNTYHHIEERPLYFSRLRDDLSPGGRVAIIEPDEDLTGVLSWFHTEGHTSSAPTIVDEMRKAGFEPVESHDFLPIQVFEVFQPTGDAS